MAKLQESGTKTIDAPAATIFDLLADPAKHPLIDGSGTVKSSRETGSQRLRLGSTFGMDMKMGMPYRIRNTVVEYEENQLIAWRHFAGHRWRWELEPVDENTTRVTETFDYSTAPAGALYPLLGFPERNRKGIEASLQRLAEVVGKS
jgi:uncharacterized protein YndB with AHSA1/START domain